MSKPGGRYEDAAEYRTNVEGWSCKTCRRFWGTDEHMAKWCCASDLPCECGGRITGNHWTICKACISRREQERLERAEKLESWDGWVWWEGHGGNNGYFESLDEFMEFLERDGIDAEGWPEWVWTCDESPFPGIDLEDVIENLAEQMGFEDASDHLVGEEELGLAIDAFNKANVANVSYNSNLKRAVRVPRPSDESAASIEPGQEATP